MGEIDHTDDAVDHRVPDGDQPVDRSKRQPVDQLLQEIRHPTLLSPGAARNCAAESSQLSGRGSERMLAQKVEIATMIGL